VTWNWATVPALTLPDGVMRQMIHGERLMVCRLQIPARTALDAHRHEHEQITMVERGRLRFLIGAEETVFGPGDVILLPSNIWHGATILDEDVVLVDIFSPIREAFLEAHR
jgi:quercetin dioxygenase-like cupin family protein